MTKQTYHSERRRFFRIEDRVYLQFQDDEQHNVGIEPGKLAESSVYPYINEFRKISAESKHYLHSAEKIDPHITAYLQALNRKIDCLAQAILFSQEEHPQDANCNIQLSEGGFSTELKQPYSPGETVKCKIILYPDNHIMLFSSKVIYCHKNESQISGDINAGGHYCIGFEFIELNEGDAHLLARHIINKQANARRQG